MSSDAKIKMTLRWEKFDGALSRGLQEMLFDKDLVDVTLACQGEYIQAHKNVLSVCSPYFKQLFKVNPCNHPIVILQEGKLSHVRSLLSFIYSGETTIPQNELSAFLRTAETLRIRGLSDSDMDDANEEQTKLQSYEEFTGSAIKRKRMTDPVETQDLQALDWNLATASTSSTNNLSADYVNLTHIKNENEENIPIDWGLTAVEDEIVFIGENPHNSIPLSNSMTLPNQQGPVVAVAAVVPTNPNLQPTSCNAALLSSSAEMLSRILIMPQGEQREESINQLVQQVRSSEGGTMQHRNSLPCKTVSEIIQLDRLLDTDKELLARMSASLGLLGGKNPFQAVRRTFSEVIGHEVAGQYRWSGTQSGKKSITTLPNILKLITNASMLNPASRSLTITEVESILKVWLRSSGDREGGRNRRRRKDSAIHQQHVPESDNHNLQQQQQQQQQHHHHHQQQQQQILQHPNQHEVPQNQQLPLQQHQTQQLHIQQSHQQNQQQILQPQLHHIEQQQQQQQHDTGNYSRSLTYPRISDSDSNNRIVIPNTNMHPRSLLISRRCSNNESSNIVVPSISSVSTEAIDNIEVESTVEIV